MNLVPANKLLLGHSLLTYIYLNIQEFKNSSNSSNSNLLLHNKNNFYMLSFIYLFETLIALVFKQSVLYKWKLKDYLQHHLGLSLFMIIYYNYGYPLDKYFINMQKYIILINSYEITAILQHFNLPKKLFVVLKFYCLYNLLNLSYYEVSESITYYKSIHSNKKYFVIFPLIAMLYHIFIVLPSTIKYIKKNI